MTILAVLQGVSLAIGLSKPDAVFTVTAREWLELQSLSNEAAAAIADAFDWQALRTMATVTGTGSAPSFNLPEDYARMVRTASMWSSRVNRPIEHVVDLNAWLAGEQPGFAPWCDQWTVYGGKLNVRPTMGSGDTLKYFYVTSNIVRSTDGTPKPAFDTDTDKFTLDERLLKLCIIYLWKQQKGFDFAAELADYEQALEFAMDRDGGSKPVVSGNSCRRPSNVWPGLVAE